MSCSTTCSRDGTGRRAGALAGLYLGAMLVAGCTSPESATMVALDPDLLPDAYRHATAALMWPGSTRAVQVTPEGDLFNGEWALAISPSAQDIAARAPRRIAYEDRWRPVARWRRYSDPIRWDFEAAALPPIAAGDSGLVVTLLVTATNTGPGSCAARLALELAAPGAVPLWVANDLSAGESPELHWAGRAADQLAHAWCAGARPASKRLEHSWTIAPGASAAVRVVFPTYPTPARRLAGWAKVNHARRIEEVRDYWNQEVDSGARFTLGDSTVERALNAAKVVLLACRERRGTDWVPVGGPFHYRDVWLRDGARVVQALSVSGHTRVARELAGGLALLQWPQGAFLSQRGQLDGTGQALWAFAQAYLRPAPGDSLARFADAAEQAWQWCEWQRDLGRRSGWPFGTLMPFGDPRDGERARAQLVGNDAWTLAGYAATVRLLAAAGRQSAADRVAATWRLYQADFERALARSASADIPPAWQPGGRDWGNLNVAYPCAALPAADRRCAALAERQWALAGGAGLVTYGGADSLHYYLGVDLATWALLAGRRAQADSVLEEMLLWRNASGGAGEIFHKNGDYGSNLPPHATSAAALVTLVRNALVYDEGDTLRLTLGARRAWWRNGSVGGVPTYWGRLDVSFREEEGVASWEWTPVPVWTQLTLPPDTRLAAAPEPPLVRGANPTQVLAPPGHGAARLRIAPSGSGQ